MNKNQTPDQKNENKGNVKQDANKAGVDKSREKQGTSEKHGDSREAVLEELNDSQKKQQRS
ncbi:general stress protein CsbD [Lacimicrobium sp. SS2-24]|uniref:general stress protein CsbD n=1 Tax=Lacimicrobium sp. SS2-24 TaxID=2005569 RepID=UPI000B4B7A67|nr:general stress protein CsbD [Lacimicrobium sp. SS2-24]